VEARSRSCGRRGKQRRPGSRERGSRARREARRKAVAEVARPKQHVASSSQSSLSGGGSRGASSSRRHRLQSELRVGHGGGSGRIYSRE
jgi:hypothetical protein